MDYALYTLDDSPWFEWIQLASADSTNNFLKHYHPVTPKDMTLATAEYQTAGRGQAGHPWESETGKPALRKKQRRRAASPRRTKTASGAAGTLPRHSCARPGRTGLRPPSAAKRSPGAPPQHAAASAIPLRRSVVALLRGKDRRASAGEPRPPNEKASFCRRLCVRTMPGARQTDAAAILWSSAAADPRSDL